MNIEETNKILTRLNYIFIEVLVVFGAFYFSIKQEIDQKIPDFYPSIEKEVVLDKSDYQTENITAEGAITYDLSSGHFAVKVDDKKTTTYRVYNKNTKLIPMKDLLEGNLVDTKNMIATVLVLDEAGQSHLYNVPLSSSGLKEEAVLEAVQKQSHINHSINKGGLSDDITLKNGKTIRIQG